MQSMLLVPESPELPSAQATGAMSIVQEPSAVSAQTSAAGTSAPSTPMPSCICVTSTCSDTHGAVSVGCSTAQKVAASARSRWTAGFAVTSAALAGAGIVSPASTAEMSTEGFIEPSFASAASLCLLFFSSSSCGCGFRLGAGLHRPSGQESGCYAARRRPCVRGPVVRERLAGGQAGRPGNIEARPLPPAWGAPPPLRARAASSPTAGRRSGRTPEEQRSAHAAGCTERVDGLRDTGVVRVTVVVEDHEPTRGQRRTPGRELGERRRALVRAVDEEQFDAAHVPRSVLPRGGKERDPLAYRRRNQGEIS